MATGSTDCVKMATNTGTGVKTKVTFPIASIPSSTTNYCNF